MRPIRKLIIHCSDTEEGTVQSIRRYHIEHNGWSDIGYHYVIYKDGSIHSGRPECVVGAHCYGFNKDSIGICLIGKHDFSKEQFETLRFMVSELKTKYKSITEVKGHGEYPNQGGKTCPNFKVSEVL